MSSRHPAPVPSLRRLGAAQVVWGVVLLGAGQELFRRLEGRVPDETEWIGLRALGARHVVQGSLEVLLPHRLGRLHAGVDAIHAGSMLLVVLLQPQRRRVAAASGGLAFLAGWRAWRCR